jgi:hypothetical protein
MAFLCSAFCARCLLIVVMCTNLIGLLLIVRPVVRDPLRSAIAERFDSSSLLLDDVCSCHAVYSLFYIGGLYALVAIALAIQYPKRFVQPVRNAIRLFCCCSTRVEEDPV